jgi:hypothetical protein
MNSYEILTVRCTYVFRFLFFFWGTAYRTRFNDKDGRCRSIDV